MLESGEAWLDSVFLSHVEVLSEVLVSAPPVGVDHGHSLVSKLLMGVRVPQIVLVSMSREPPIRCRVAVMLVVLTNVPSPVSNHILFFGFSQEIEHK